MTVETTNVTTPPNFRTRIRKMLGRSDKQIEQAVGPLSELWRTLLCDLNIDFNRWNSLMIDYLYSQSIEDKNNAGNMADLRQNMTKALTNDSLTLKIFIRGLKLLKTETAKFEVTLHRTGIPAMTQSAEIYFNGYNEKVSLVESKPVEVESDIKRRFFHRASPSALLVDQAPTKPLTKMLRDDHRLSNKATGVLSKLWRQALTELRFDAMAWNSAIVTYLNRCTFKEDENASKKRSNIRGNLNKELVKNNMSTLVFIKGMAFLNVESIDLTLYLKRKDSIKTTVHKTKYQIPTPDAIYQDQERKRHHKP